MKALKRGNLVDKVPGPTLEPLVISTDKLMMQLTERLLMLTKPTKGSHLRDR